MADTEALVDASPFFSSYSDPPCFDPCILNDDLSAVPTDFGDFNLDMDFSIDEFLRSPDRSGNGSSEIEWNDSIEPAGVRSPDSGGFSNESDLTSPDVKLEDEIKANWGLKRKNRSEEEFPLDNSKEEEDDEKKKARLIRNRESAQLSRQRKKKYMEELEEKVKSMHSVINDLNTKISYVMAENASLRQQIGGTGGNLGQSGIYPPPGMHFPWIPSYALRPHGAPVPLVPIPRVKPQNPAPAQKVKKSESSKKAKKVAGISVLGLILLTLFCGAFFSGFSNSFGEKGGIFGSNLSGRLVDNSTVDSGFQHNLNLSEHNLNLSESLPAMLYVPRNGKHVEINGNLIIHSVLASEKAMGNKQPVNEGDNNNNSNKEATSLALAGYLPANKYGKSSKSDGPAVPQWFREGMAGPILGSGMCTEVFQFDVSSQEGSIIPAKTVINATNSITNSTEHNKMKRNRRIMYNNAIPLPGKTLNNNTNTNNDNKPVSKVVVSVLADPRETNNDGDKVSPKSLSRVFVVVLLDGVKYVTYSCVIPFKNAASHLVKY